MCCVVALEHRQFAPRWLCRCHENCKSFGPTNTVSDQYSRFAHVPHEKGAFRVARGASRSSSGPKITQLTNLDFSSALSVFVQEVRHQVPSSLLKTSSALKLSFRVRVTPVFLKMSEAISPISDQQSPSVQNLPPQQPQHQQPQQQQQQSPNASLTSPSKPRPRTCPHTGRRRRFRFKESHDVAMLEAVMKTGAHVAPHGLAQRLFDESTAQLFTAGTFSDVVDGPLPTPKTIWDRFRHLVHAHRNGNLRPTCGRGDIFQERERLLDVVTRSIANNVDDVLRTGERRKVTGVKRTLKPREERPVRRRIEETNEQADPVSQEVVETQPDLAADAVSPSQKKDDETNIPTAPQTGKTEEGWKRDLERLRLDLEKRRFEADEAERKRRFEIEARHAKIEEERTVIEMRRLEMEDQERKSARQERQALTSLLSALAQSLMKK